MNRADLKKTWDDLASSYWFVPAVLCATAATGAVLLTTADREISWGPGVLRWIDAGEIEGARAILALVATSAITIVSLTFSVTIVALTLASNQFGSRLLYSFMRDRSTQVALGTFVGVFVFCVIVMRRMRSDPDAPFVPHLAVSAAIVLAILGIAVLIYFIHHVAHSIQASSVVASVRNDLCNTIERFFPEPDGAPSESSDELETLPAAATVDCRATGIVQAIEVAGLLQIAVECDARIHVLRRPGDHVIRGTPLAEIRSRASTPDGAPDRVREQFVLGARRTLIQDVEFALLQLVEIAVRALSPGINDPFTACACIDELGSGIARIMQKADLREVELDRDGRPRVVLSVSSFEGMVEAAFNQIRQHGCGNVAVVTRMLEVLTELVGIATRDAHVDALAVQADAVFNAATSDALASHDRAAIEGRHEAFVAACRGRG